MSKELPTTSGIYAIKKYGVVVYIGSAKNLRQRWNGHQSALNRQDKRKCNPHLLNAWNLYGEDAFEFVVIDRVPVALLLIREQLHMNLYPDSYNICREAGSPLGRTHTDEWKAQASERMMGNTNLAGHVHTEETKALMSESHMGNTNSLGHKQSPETISKRVISRKGYSHSDETRARISAGLTGHEVSEGAREKISEANRGQKRTDETRARMRASRLAYLERKRAEEANV